MNLYYLFVRVLRIVFACLGLCLLIHDGKTASSEELMKQEFLRRQTLAKPLEESLKSSEILAQKANFEEASESLEKAYTSTSEGIRQSELGARVREKLAEYNARIAQAAIRENRWPDARKRALACLSYDPDSLEGREALSQADQVLRRGLKGDEQVNPALTANFFDRLNQVNQGLLDAKRLRETGQLELAETKYESVLKADPFNQEAIRGIKKIYEERSLVAEKTRQISNLEQRRLVREEWNNIYPKTSTSTVDTATASAMTASPTFALENKLKKTIIPTVDFTGADMDTVRRALNTLSRQYDPESDKKGITFVVSSDLADAQLVNLKLRQVSLEKVVQYISRIAGVKARVTPEIGVVFAPLTEKRPDLITRTFNVGQNFFKDISSKDSSTTTAIRGGGGPAPSSPGSKSTVREMDYLTGLGVQFPEGAYAIYEPRTSQLKVANNAEMLDMIGQLIAASEEQTLLIRVDCRLVEINQADLDSLAVNSTFGGSGIGALSTIPVGLSTNGTGGTPNGSTQKGFTAQMNQIQGVGLLPNNTLTSFLQSGVLAGTNQSSAYALNTLDLSGTIFNSLQFRAFIAAISQKNSANVLASPSITLKRGQKGVVEVSQEFRYVKEYNDPQSSIRTFTPTSLNGTGNSQQQTAVPGPETVISSFPSQISDPVAIGAKLNVEPDIAGDNDRVSLKIVPSFIDFEGFINYGTVVNSAYAASYYNTTTAILTNNIQQPVFIKREITFEDGSIEVDDGHTLLLGGLLREDIQKIDEKVPVIGDIPLLGRAFQGKTEQAIKKNTLIFVTPRILTVDGKPLNPTAGTPLTTASTGP